MYLNLAVLAAFVFIYSIVSGRLDRTVFNGAILFTTFGLIVGPLGLGILNLNVDVEGLRTLAELTLHWSCLPMLPMPTCANSNIPSTFLKSCC